MLILDDEVARGFTAGRQFATNIVNLAGGVERRNRRWLEFVRVFAFSFDNADLDDIRAVIDHFIDVGGAADTWLIKDWLHFSITDQELGTGDAATYDFPIFSEHGSENPIQKRIRYVKAGTLAVKVAGSPSTDWTETNGIISFLDSPDSAPGVGEVVTASCEYYVPVRFRDDQIVAQMDARTDFAQLPGLAAVEVLESDD